jgi:hypothetical protein
MKPSKEYRFMAKVSPEPNSGCWLWIGALHSAGYGQVSTGRHAESIPAHRMSHVLFCGPIPDGMDVHHKCENRICVNPKHLMLTTRSHHLTELSPRTRCYKNKRKTHCPKGHPYDGENVRVVKTGRQCKICSRLRERERSRKTATSGRRYAVGEGPYRTIEQECCYKGHPYTPSNTIWRLDGKSRKCRQCQREAGLRSYYKRRKHPLEQ